MGVMARYVEDSGDEPWLFFMSGLRSSLLLLCLLVQFCHYRTSLWLSSHLRPIFLVSGSVILPAGLFLGSHQPLWLPVHEESEQACRFLLLCPVHVILL